MGFQTLYEVFVVTELATKVKYVFVAIHQPIIIVVSHLMEVATKFLTLAFVIRLQDSYHSQGPNESRLCSICRQCSERVQILWWPYALTCWTPQLGLPHAWQRCFFCAKSSTLALANAPSRH